MYKNVSSSSFLFLSLLLSLLGVSFGNIRIGIHSADELIEFSNNVSSGTTYSGTTVFLDSDLMFSGQTLAPIGYSSSYSYVCFNGVFDGQGHTISNLTFNSNRLTYGLFGYSSGLTVKNVVIDETCSFTSTYYSFSGDVFAGIFIGKCNPASGSCVIDSCINMGNLAFTGYTSYSLYLGGILGYLSSSSNYDSYVRNCVNYGSITKYSFSGYTYVGGHYWRFSWLFIYKKDTHS